MEDTRLGAILLETRLVPEQRLHHCLEIQALTGGARPLGQILVEQGVITQRVLDDLLRIQEARRRAQRVRAMESAVAHPAEDELFARAIKIKASDLIVSEGRPPAVRIAGNIRQLGEEPMSGPDVWDFVRSQLGSDSLDRIAQRGSLTRALSSSRAARGRVSAFRHLDGLGATIRLHPAEIRAPQDAGIDEALIEAVQTGRGLVLIAGEQNSGVTETFASLLDSALATSGRSVHVLDRCFEYPTSRVGAVVTRREIGTHASRLDDATRAALREEPDVLFVGEVDEPSLPLLLHASEHCGIVVACVRARGVIHAIQRLLSLCAPHERDRARMVIAGTCLAVLAVRTVPRADGCGMALATGHVRFDDTVRHVVRSGSLSRIASLIRVEGAECGHALDCSLIRLVRDGAVEMGDAFPFAEDKGWFLGEMTPAVGAHA